MFDNTGNALLLFVHHYQAGNKMALLNVAISEETQRQINELVKKRIGEHNLVNKKKSITAQAIEALYKKEVKK